jgi:hypothetical protein
VFRYHSTNAEDSEQGAWGALLMQGKMRAAGYDETLNFTSPYERRGKN